jgi:hypothetical protein
MTTAALLALSILPQTSADLRLKLREDETVKFRSVLNVVTYSPDKIDERVANTLLSFTFGAERDAHIPVKAVIEELEDMDPANGNAVAALRPINFSFSMDKRGRAQAVAHATSVPALEPYAKIMAKTIEGLNAIGFLGTTMPEKPVAVGEKWTMKVAAQDFLGPALAPVGDAFKVTGTYDVTFTLLDVVNVNNKSHARIQADVTGKSDIEIETPEFNAGGTLTVTSTSSILIELATGLPTRTKSDVSADLDLGVANAQIEISNLIYRV